MPNRGGTHEQHGKAGRQNHKNDDNTKQQHAQGGANQKQQRGGKGNFADERQRASEAGKKGGKS